MPPARAAGGTPHQGGSGVVVEFVCGGLGGVCGLVDLVAELASGDLVGSIGGLVDGVIDLVAVLGGQVLSLVDQAFGLLLEVIDTGHGTSVSLVGSRWSPIRRL